ncbi:hypothetical protein RHSIM_Rhsim01G0090200 [Rhododendron simsii]|uniref:Protein FAR1-RELATED SEQUENCE n=1 Tax=Rhododendron simsii TaxID=118357 RepID=A0A834HJI3_RHOSS|nr:hypothetical protein RHSIM_Rhsim01G0090200 [Rhododendron simsii]
MDDNVQRNGKNVVIDICDDSNNDDGNDEKRLDELMEEEVYQMTFDMHEDGETFYNAYARVNGFSIRNYNLHKDNAGIVKSRKWVCSKEGYRDTQYLEREDRIRGPQALTRVGCPAVFSVTLERSSGKYLVNNFVSVHNHSMIGPCGVPFLCSHRKVSSSDKASANTMHKVGIKTSHIMDFAAQQSGGYESVGYTQKDLYNHFTAQRNIEVADGDAEGALAYLCAKAKNDPLFYYKYDVDEQNRLNNLFWRDVTCRTDYMCFGDVLIFDSTYRTNAHRKPLVIPAGVNSHFQIAIFGCALLTTETVETYTWVLERFLDSMDHKKTVSPPINLYCIWNFTTHQFVLFPPPPPLGFKHKQQEELNQCLGSGVFSALAFDPKQSLHFKVVRFDHSRSTINPGVRPLHIFSSETRELSTSLHLLQYDLEKKVNVTVLKLPDSGSWTSENTVDDLGCIGSSLGCRLYYARHCETRVLIWMLCDCNDASDWVLMHSIRAPDLINHELSIECTPRSYKQNFRQYLETCGSLKLSRLGFEYLAWVYAQSLDSSNPMSKHMGTTKWSYFLIGIGLTGTDPSTFMTFLCNNSLQLNISLHSTFRCQIDIVAVYPAFHL